MAKIILFIRDPGRPDFTDVHDSHMQAKAALLDHVKSRWSFSDLAIPTDSERAIKDFFARSGEATSSPKWKAERSAH